MNTDLKTPAGASRIFETYHWAIRVENDYVPLMVDPVTVKITLSISCSIFVLKFTLCERHFVELKKPDTKEHIV